MSRGSTAAGRDGGDVLRPEVPTLVPQVAPAPGRRVALGQTLPTVVSPVDRVPPGWEDDRYESPVTSTDPTKTGRETVSLL